MGVKDRLSHAFNAFVDGPKKNQEVDIFRPASGMSSASLGARADRPRTRMSNERTMIASLYTRLGIDVAAIDIRHVRVDRNKRYIETISSGLNECLTTEANIDQTGSAFRMDIAMTLFDKGVIALVPVETDIDPRDTTGYDIKNMRVGEITDWFPDKVRVSLYNEKTGKREELTLPKRMIGIVENPLYNVMNEPNSTLQRLIRKLNLLDSVDEAAGSGKLDLIVQLPYVIKSDARRAEAEQRRADIQEQLRGSSYGIAYTDGTERITQLNRPAENNMLKQIQYLTDMLYSQLGLTPEVFNGTATEEVMLNYHNRTIEPILRAITEELHRKFLSKTARSQNQAVKFFRDPFKLVPIASIAEMADKFTRNEILSANEIRGVVGFSPADDPKADELRNSNMPQPKDEERVPVEPLRPKEDLGELKQITSAGKV